MAKLQLLLVNLELGKSTLFNALTRLVDPKSGSINIDGINTKNISLKNLRSLFSVVSQDALLFDETLIENILLGNKNISKEKIKQVLDDANVTKFISTLSNGRSDKIWPQRFKFIRWPKATCSNCKSNSYGILLFYFLMKQQVH